MATAKAPLIAALAPTTATTGEAPAPSAAPVATTAITAAQRYTALEESRGEDGYLARMPRFDGRPSANLLGRALAVLSCYLHLCTSVFAARGVMEYG